MSQVFFLFLSMREGCYISLGDREKAKELFGKVPTLLDKRKYGGKELPTEVLIKKQSNYDSSPSQVSRFADRLKNSSCVLQGESEEKV